MPSFSLSRSPDYNLHIVPSNMENLNDRRYLEFVSQKLFEVLDRVEAAPGVAINTGAAGDSRTALQGPPDQNSDIDGDDVRRPDGRVRDEGAWRHTGGREPSTPSKPFQFCDGSHTFSSPLTFSLSPALPRRCAAAAAPGRVL